MHWMQRVEGQVQRYAHLVLVVLGLILLVLLIVMAMPLLSTKPGEVIDAVLKVVAVIVIGALLPRIASFEFGNAKLVLREDVKRVIGDLNARTAELTRVRNLAPGDQINAKADSFEPYPKPELPKITNFADPQSGRFGGKADNGPFHLSASILEAKANSGVVRLWIEVRKEGDEGLVAPVTLYLHNTFTPDELIIDPIGGVAGMELVVWGGFTIGAIPHEATDHPLELNLADLPLAPRLLRDN